MYRNLIPTLSLIVLLGCATGHFVPDVPMRKVGPHTRVGVQHTDSGFRMRVDYTEKNTTGQRVRRGRSARAPRAYDGGASPPHDA